MFQNRCQTIVNFEMLPAPCGCLYGRHVRHAAIVATGSSWSERWNLELLQCGQCLLLDLAAVIVSVA